MKYSESITKIAPALLKAQQKIGAAKKGASNPFFKSTYADLGAVMEACKDALNENDISVLQPVGTNEYGTYVETVLLHTSGEWISDTMRIAPKTEHNPQDQGSAISYARRYSLQSMVFIPAEDDDGNRASGKRQSDLPQEEKKHNNGFKVTEKQLNYIKSLLKQKGKTEEELAEEYEISDLTQLSGDQASTIIGQLMKLPSEKPSSPVKSAPTQQAIDEDFAADVSFENDTEDSPTDSYSGWSVGKLRVEVGQLMNKGKIKKEFDKLNKLTREELIASIESTK